MYRIKYTRKSKFPQSSITKTIINAHIDITTRVNEEICDL